MNLKTKEMNEIHRTTADYKGGVVLWRDTLTTGKEYTVVSTGERTGDTQIIRVVYP